MGLEWGRCPETGHGTGAVELGAGPASAVRLGGTAVVQGTGRRAGPVGSPLGELGSQRASGGAGCRLHP